MGMYEGGPSSGASRQLLDAYRRQQVETASPLQLIVMLYDGAIRHCRGAELAIEQQDRQRAREHLLKAQDIVAELLASLDMEKGGELAASLAQLYGYIHARLVAANVQQDAAAAREARRLLSGLREAWAQLSAAGARGAAAPAPPRLAAG